MQLHYCRCSCRATTIKDAASIPVAPAGNRKFCFQNSKLKTGIKIPIFKFLN